MASLAKGVAVLLRTQEHLKQMQFAGPTLDTLHRRFMKWQGQSPCAVESYIETKGIARNGRLARILPRIKVVPRISGDPRLAGCDCHPIPADHITLVKPANSDSAVYNGVRRFIEKALSAAAAPAAACVAAPEPSQSPAQFRIELSRIDRYAPAALIGREDDTQPSLDANPERGHPARPNGATDLAGKTGARRERRA